jgi:hypothetical protein
MIQDDPKKIKIGICLGFYFGDEGLSMTSQSVWPFQKNLTLKGVTVYGC